MTIPEGLGVAYIHRESLRGVWYPARPLRDPGVRRFSPLEHIKE